MNAMVGHGWLTLLYKELLRFWKVSFQTIAAPILTALLYLLIFSHVLEGRNRDPRLSDLMDLVEKYLAVLPDGPRVISARLPAARMQS